MTNMSVTYRGPDGMSAQLWDEVRARYGARAQNKGFVTGYMGVAAAGETGGHFADQHGVTHAVDIGVDIEADGTGLLPADALALAEHLRALGAAGRHPFARRGYLIHDMSKTLAVAPRIAGFHTGWKWELYRGASPHSDHIHVTTGGDQQWGSAPQLVPAVYNSRQSWGIATAGTSTGGGGAVSGAMRPVPAMYPITQNFADNATIYNYGTAHGAIDYGVPQGTPVVALEDALVGHADWSFNLPGGPGDWTARDFQIKPPVGDTRTGGGIMVKLVNSIGARWWVCHLSRTDLNPGDRVRRGQIIGYSGNTGSSTGPHTHVALLPPAPNWSNGTYGSIDPAPYIVVPYAPTTYTAWQGAPTGGQGTPADRPKDILEELIMATPQEIDKLFNDYFARNRGKAGTWAWYDANARDRGVSLERAVARVEKLTSAIADAVRPSTLAYVLWGYVNPNEKKADPKAPDAYGRLTQVWRALSAPPATGSTTTDTEKGA